MSSLLYENLITWNVGNGSAKDLKKALSELITIYKPVGLVLEEVADRLVILKQVSAETGYELIVFDQGNHSTELALLIRNDIPKGTPGIKQMTPRTQVGKNVKGAEKDGWTAAKWVIYSPITFWNTDWYLTGTHLTPSHQVPAVRQLVKKQVATIKTAFIDVRPRMVLLAGDFNETLDSKYQLLAPLKDVATPFTVPSLGKRAVDMWWVELDRMMNQRISVHANGLNGYPSDHRPVMLAMSMVNAHKCPLCGFEHEIAANS